MSKFCKAAVLALSASSAIAVRLRGPDNDHMVHESIDHAKHEGAPLKDTIDKDFIALDRNHDGKLDQRELMFRQYATGCEASVAQARSLDYLHCGDANKDNVISAEEFKASVEAPWADCVKNLKDRRVHGFVRFFEADKDWDDKLSKDELSAGIVKMWGPAGVHLAKPLLTCVDKNKNKHVDQGEFHDMVSAYNPATRNWQMWKGTSDPEILKCLEPAFKQFDNALVFSAADENKNDKLSKQECFNIIEAVNGPKIDHKVADALFVASDLDKDGFLNLDEFSKSGASYKGAGESFALQNSTAVTSMKGVGSQCMAMNGDEAHVYESSASFASNTTKL